MTLIEACNQIGIEYKETPLDGKWHTTAVIGKGGKNTAGRIKLFTDGQGGTVANWTSGETLTFWNDDTPAKLTAAQREERAARIAAAKQQEEADKAECCKKSAELWELATREVPADHPYLIKKNVKPYGIRWQKSGNLLVVPIEDMAGTLHGLQFIDPEGNKKFKTGSNKTGHFYGMGEAKGNTLCIAEGYATAASIHQTTGYPVLVAFDAGNLKPVAEIVMAQCPHLRIIICGDNDQWTPGNPGLTKATEAARAVNGLLAFPIFQEVTNE